MTDITLDQRSARRLDFSRVREIFLRPRQAFQAISSESRATWLTPMLLLTITAALVVFMGGYQESRAAMKGEITLPPDWEFWTPEMQDNYMRAQQATQGSTFLYVFPLVGALTGLWVGWLLLAGLLHFGSTLLGGRGSMQSALNVVAWSSLPFAIRDLLRVIFMLSTGHAIISPGLSGFASSAGLLSQLLMRFDIFLIWNIVLLVIGFGIAEGLSRGKAVTGVLIVILLVLFAQAGLGALLSGMGGTAVQRPFF